MQVSLQALHSPHMLWMQFSVNRAMNDDGDIVVKTCAIGYNVIWVYTFASFLQMRWAAFSVHFLCLQFGPPFISENMSLYFKSFCVPCSFKSQLTLDFSYSLSLSTQAVDCCNTFTNILLWSQYNRMIIPYNWYQEKEVEDRKPPSCLVSLCGIGGAWVVDTVLGAPRLSSALYSFPLSSSSAASLYSYKSPPLSYLSHSVHFPQFPSIAQSPILHTWPCS